MDLTANEMKAVADRLAVAAHQLYQAAMILEGGLGSAAPPPPPSRSSGPPKERTKQPPLKEKKESRTETPMRVLDTPEKFAIELKVMPALGTQPRRRGDLQPINPNRIQAVPSV